MIDACYTTEVHHTFSEVFSFWELNALTTGNPFFFLNNLLELIIGRELGALKGLRPPLKK